MKPTTPDEVLELLDASFPSAALGAALELGLFSILADQPQDAAFLGRRLGISAAPCAYWLQMLCDLGLLEPDPRGYRLTPAARTGILEACGPDSWTLLAQEARERLTGLLELPQRLRESGGEGPARTREPPEYVSRMAADPERARRFTRMLYELHQPLAEGVAVRLDMTGVHRVMDLGGGSGVMSLALLRRFPGLTAVVVDIPTVCEAGREIAAEHSLLDRITYHPADFLRDALPSGFDLVLECDINVYGEALFRKIHGSLNPGGRFVIIDQFLPADDALSRPFLRWAFESSLADRDFLPPTSARIRGMLERAGFRILSETPLALGFEPFRRVMAGMTMMESRT